MPLQAFPREQWVQRRLPTKPQNLRLLTKQTSFPTYFMTPSIKDDNKNGTLSYSIYVWNKTGYELFSSDDARAQNYAQTINGFADKFGSSVKVYDMIVPNHTEMGLPQRLKDSDAPSTSQADNIKAAYAALSDKVTPINCYNRLAEHNTDYIYFKSDHH